MMNVKMNGEEAKTYVDGVYRQVADRWQQRVYRSQFMKALVAGKLPKETFRLFFKNWAAYTIEINTLEAASYHKHIHFFRKNRDLMAAMAEKLADELIHPKPPGHIHVVMETTKALDLRQRRRAGAACGIVHGRDRCVGIIAAGDPRGGSLGHEYPRASKRFEGGLSSDRDHVRRSFLEKNRDAAKHFVRAYSEAIHQFKTDKAKAMAVYANRLKQQDSKVLDATYDYFAPKFSLPPRVERDGLRNSLELVSARDREAKGEINVEQFIDQSVIDELEREGFFKKLR